MHKLFIVFKFLKNYLKREDYRTFNWVIIIGFLSGLISVFSSLLVFPYIDLLMNETSNNSFSIVLRNLFLVSSEKSAIINIGLVVLVLQIIAAVLSFGAIIYRSRFVYRLYHELSLVYLEKYLYLPYEMLSNKNTGDLSKSILSDSQQISVQYIGATMDFFIHIMTLLFFVIVLIFVNPTITIILILFLSLLAALFLFLSTRILWKIGRETNMENRQRFKIVNDIISNMKLIRVTNTEHYFLNNFSMSSEHFKAVNIKNSIVFELPKSIIELSVFTLVIGILFFASLFGMDIKSIIPLLGLYLISIYRMMPSILKINAAIHSFSTSIDVFKQFEEILEFKTVVKTQGNEIHFNNDIEFKNISFNYKNRNDVVFENLSLKIHKNEMIGIFGPSGSGKTTLLDLLLNLYQPNDGQILIDHQLVSHKDLNLSSNLFAYIPQETYILNASIKENIALGYDKTEIDETKIKNVLSQVSLLDLVEKELPNKLETIVGERGLSLSGGQRQRLGIARALYMNRDILIFDEATSALDYKTEKEILDVLNSLKGHKTIIVVSHRVDSLDSCDHIYDLNNKFLTQYK